MTRALLCALLALLLAPLAYGQTVDLTYAPEIGSTRGYNVSIEGTFDTPGIKGLVLQGDSCHIITIQERSDEGFLQEIQLGRTYLSAGTQALPSNAEGCTAGYVLDGRALVAAVTRELDLEDLDVGDMFGLVASFLHELGLPAQEIAVGESWETEQAEAPSILSAYGLDTRLTTEGKLVALAEGVATLETRQVRVLTGEDQEATCETTCVSRVAVATWTLLSAEAKVTLTNRQGGETMTSFHDATIRLELGE